MTKYLTILWITDIELTIHRGPLLWTAHYWWWTMQNSAYAWQFWNALQPAYQMSNVKDLWGDEFPF